MGKILVRPQGDPIRDESGEMITDESGTALFGEG